MTILPYAVMLLLCGLFVSIQYLLVPYWFPDAWEWVSAKGRIILTLLTIVVSIFLGHPIADLADAAVSYKAREALTDFVNLTQTDGIKFGAEYDVGSPGHAGCLRADSIEHLVEDARKGVYGHAFGPHILQDGGITDFSVFEIVRDERQTVSVRRVR